MLFDLGWSEILLIGTVALVFIGPKDLPKAMRVAGFWVRKARTLSREFQSSIDQMIREAELDEMRQELKKAAELDLNKEFHNTIDPTGSLRESLSPPELPDFSATVPVREPASGTAAENTATTVLTAEATASDNATTEFHSVLAEPVPMVAGPESEPDEPAHATPITPPAVPAEHGDHGFVPPKP
ncbi:MAG: Sec-independent protein translocase protein TatB [Stellaceae bacterium]